MTKAEETAYHEGKLARLLDEREQASGSRSLCPYRNPLHVQAWKNGYNEQALDGQTSLPMDGSTEQRRVEFATAIEQWMEKHK